MFRLRTILVATDLGLDADEAIRQGDTWAEASGARLIASVVLPSAPVWPLFPHLSVTDAAATPAMEAALIGEVLDRIRNVTGRTAEKVQVRVEHGVPYAEIVRAAELTKADLVVVGAQPRVGLRGLFLGKTAERIVRHAHCPVLVARPSAATGSILAATDLSDPSLPALRAGQEYARWRQGTLTALHCYEHELFPPIGSGGFAIPLPNLEERARMRDAAKGALDDALSRSQVRAEARVEEGPPAQTIIDTAERLPAELVVVGTTGRTGLARLALGSVAEAVVRSAPCSTLVVRLHAKPDGETRSPPS
jgi:nucleotide-binding universal stress UspA family protein